MARGPPARGWVFRGLMGWLAMVPTRPYWQQLVESLDRQGDIYRWVATEERLSDTHRVEHELSLRRGGIDGDMVGKVGADRGTGDERPCEFGRLQEPRVNLGVKSC